MPREKHLASPANGFVSIQGAPAASLAGDLLTLTFADTRLLPLYAPLQHSVVIHDGATAFLTAGSDIVFGNAGDNAFFGSGGNDYLNALGGTDTMNLGAQFQNFIFTLNADGSLNAQDRRGGSPLGRDVLLNFELFHFSDGLLLTLAQLTATQGSTTITGTAGNDVLDGTASNQLILGLAGNDIINARFSNETLDGGGGADQLFDNGFDFISLIGGGGGDIFYVNNAGTSVTEVAGGTSDTIRTTLNTYVLPANIEFLEFVGSGDFAATANAANQRLSGAAGNDTLGNGGFATVRLTGGGGNDTYTVTGATATIVEAANGGTDTVLTTLNSYTTLAGNVENLTFTGTGNFTGNGNGLANILTGGAGDDTLSANGGIDRLIGGIGNDRMTGGGLNDTFVFNPGFGRDIITDFRANANNPNNHDILELSASMFAVGTTASSLLNDLTHVAQVGANVVITVDAADTITLNNVNLNTLKLYAATDILLI